jgi:DNA mismatch endonuclease (patch repair protein)
MADVVTPEKRSQMMAGIQGKNTKPELIIRSGLHRRGYRFRLHDRRLPGKPDLYFPRFRAVLFVNGCFWHGHDCKYFRIPSTRSDFWNSKISQNRMRDERTRLELDRLGVRHLTVWECETRNPSSEIEKLLDAIERWIRQLPS